MTSMNTCRLIRCNNDRPGKTPTPFHHGQTDGHSFPCPRHGAHQPYPEVRYFASRDFDNQLRLYERMARRQHVLLLKALALETLPGWFDKMLHQRIRPTLNRIGFDEQISKGLFGIASSSWCRMGPANDKIIAFHPKIDQEIEDVRQGLKLKAGRNNDTLGRRPDSAPTLFSGTINANPSPSHLFDLLDNIATPWIVLPRALRFLKKDQCRYLPAYLAVIEQERRESSLMLFSRITVEFVGNFCLKFAERRYRPDQVAKLLFYGYAALFWKTLRCPPENLESSAAFDIFFNWIGRLIRTNAYLGKVELRSIEQMKKMKVTIFPSRMINSSWKPGRANSSRFLVTLRHGCMGLATVLNYFGIDQFRATRRIRGRIQSPSLQNDLQGLLDTIQLNYHRESTKTRGYINQFMSALRSASELLQPNPHQSNLQFWMRRFNNIQL